MTLKRKLAAEGLGTMLLLATVVGSGIMGERLSGGNVAIALLANSLATGAMLVAIILAFGGISGAHFNPVVTLVLASRGGALHIKSCVPPLRGSTLLCFLTPGSRPGLWLYRSLRELIQPRSGVTSYSPGREPGVKIARTESPVGAARPTLCAKPDQGIQGSLTVNVAPFPGPSLSAPTVPPSIDTNSFTTASPRPKPS